MTGRIGIVVAQAIGFNWQGLARGHEDSTISCPLGLRPRPVQGQQAVGALPVSGCFSYLLPFRSAQGLRECSAWRTCPTALTGKELVG